MTPRNKIRRAILRRAIANNDYEWDGPLDTDGDVADAYDHFTGLDAHWDYESGFREGEVETKLPSLHFSRHYEAKEVAAKMADGSWVGWTYWHGGGKHGEPGAIDWMKDAYDLTCVETQELVTVRKFEKVEGVVGNGIESTATTTE